MKIKAVLKHFASGTGCFLLYDQDNHYLGAMSVEDADALATSINQQIESAERDAKQPTDAEEELADNARREALNGAGQ